ncbi:hypothetical protein, partial [Novosphingobium album (ex Liu et al. 2023)]
GQRLPSTTGVRVQRMNGENGQSGKTEGQPKKPGWQAWQIAAATLGALFVFALFHPEKPSAPRASKAGAGTGAASQSPAKSEPAAPSPATEAAVIAFKDSVMSAMAPCDEASNQLAEAGKKLGSGTSVYDVYPVARAAETACSTSWSRLSDLDVPSALQGEAADAADTTIESCKDASVAKQISAKSMAEVLDGNMRPSAIEEVKSNAEEAQRSILACVANIYVTAGKANVDIAKLGKKDAAR